MTNIVKVEIQIARPVTDSEFDALVEQQCKENEARAKEIKDELKVLKAQKESANEAQKADIDSKIAALEKENEDILEHGYSVSQIIKRHLLSEIEDFAKKHFPEQYDSLRFVGSIMTIMDVNVTPEMVFELLKNEKVVYVIPVDHSLGGDCRNVPSVNEGTFSENKLNQIYNLIDGEAFINAGHAGFGVNVGMVENSSPDSNQQYDVDCALAWCQY